MRFATRSITIGVLSALACLASTGSALAKASGTAVGNDVSPWAISCSSPGNCAVAGTYAYASPFPELTIFNEHNGVWSKGIEPKLPTAVSTDEWALVATDGTDLKRMDDVACPADGDCVAIGEYLDAQENLRFARFTETNGTWSKGVLLSLPANAIKPGLSTGLEPTADVALDSISCSSVGNCAVVGYYQAGGTLQGLLFTEVGGVWSRGVDVPLPGAAPADEFASLEEISCVAGGTCTATGTWTSSAGTTLPWTVTEQDGAVQSSISISLPANTDTTASDDPLATGVAISCADGQDCLGGGYYSDQFNNVSPLLISESGGSWSSSEVTLPSQAAPSSSAGAQDSAVGPVSCAAAGDCSGALSFKDTFNNGQIGVFTETSGNVGAATEVQLPSNATTDHAGNEDATGNMISCSSPGNCVLVGSYNTSLSDVLPLSAIEQNGAWAAGIQGDEPANAGSQADGLGLELVACPADGDCTAVGDYAVGTHNLEGYVDPMNGWNWGQPAELTGPGASLLDYRLALSLLITDDATTLKKVRAADGFATDAVFIKAGTESASWYANVNGRRTLIASLSKRGRVMREYSVSVRLTAAGKALLKAAKSFKVTASGIYAPKGAKKIEMTEHFKLK